MIGFFFARSALTRRTISCGHAAISISNGIAGIMRWLLCASRAPDTSFAFLRQAHLIRTLLNPGPSLGFAGRNLTQRAVRQGVDAKVQS
jgi:hypothetical protein